MDNRITIYPHKLDNGFSQNFPDSYSNQHATEEVQSAQQTKDCMIAAMITNISPTINKVIRFYKSLSVKVLGRKELYWSLKFISTLIYHV